MAPCEMCAELRSERDFLRQQVTLLQAAALTPTLPAVTPTLPPKKVDPIAEAIRDVSGTDAALRKHLFTWVKRERAMPEGTEGKLSESELLNRITHWESPEAILV